MDSKVKELVAIGASITLNCQPCLQYHLSKANECGVDKQDIEEAIAVAKMVRKGADAKMDEAALKMLSADSASASKEEACCSEKSGCCC